MQSCDLQQLDQYTNATFSRKMSKNPCKALSLLACILIPWFLYICSRQPTELQELEERGVSGTTQC